MTLLVVLGVVVIATIFAALYLSLKSGRGDEPAPGGAGADDRQAGGGSRSARSPSLAGRVRSMPDQGKAAGSSRRRFGGDDDDEYDMPDYVAARRSSRGGGDRSGLVAAGTGQRAAGGRAAAARGGFDNTDPALHAGYGPDGAGYDGYDAAADTRVSGPMGAEPGTGPYGAEPGNGPYGAEPGTGPYGTGGYDTNAYDAGPSRGYGSEPSGGYRGQDSAGEHGRATNSPRRRSPGSARQGTGGSEVYPPPDRYSPAGHRNPVDRRDSPRTGRRRIAKIQKPQLRMGRSRQDYDNDPWPSADEIDGLSDDQFWSDLSSDKPLATTARTAQTPGDSGQFWAPGDRLGGPGPSAGPGSPDKVSTPLQAGAPPMGRGHPARRHAEEPEEGPEEGTEPRPLQQPGGPGGSRRRGEPVRPAARGAEEDPLTSASFSRHAREASDSRSYRGSRQAHRPSHGRLDESAAETQAMRPDPRGYEAPGPARPGSPRRGAPGPGGQPGPGGTNVPGQQGTLGLPPAGHAGPGGPGGPGGWPGSSGTLPPAGSGGPDSASRATGPGRATGPSGPGGPNAVGGPAGRRDPYGDGRYRNGTRPAGAYPEGTGGYEPPARGSRHASPPGAGRPPAASGPRRARPTLPGPASSGPSYPDPSYPDPSYPGTNGSSAYPGTSGNSAYPGTSGDSPYPGGSGGPGGYPRGRRSSNGDSRRPDDPYDDPYGRPDDRY